MVKRQAPRGLQAERREGLMATELKHGSAPADTISVAGHDLVSDLIGKRGFSELVALMMSGGELPSEGEAALIDAILVTFADHGVTPSSIAARLTLLGAPESFQAAVAAGLCGAGMHYLGTMEFTAALLQAENGASPLLSPRDIASKIVVEHRAAKRPIPGLGHPEHKNGDPRTPVLLELAEHHGLRGRHIDILLELPAILEEAAGIWLPVNAAGITGAIVSDMGKPPIFGRGLAIIARAGGLVGQLMDEKKIPTAQGIWDSLR
ncbi:citryl-CoA lyase [Rhodococcus opacus]|uniref:citryl-CoA lyase n=2 Tax=Rhodococcus opacus TaxID=37919 RepID=UPI0024B98B4E|nr:citryl-CoA lyase [Rhodococcus opacus]MDJ0420576.1 citryl-CoA lyase [Rhodococcus opacus]MDV7089087.1 citryl-CoA lyase [Rhodococcus opacus]